MHKVKIHVVSTSELHANEVISSINTFLLKLLTLSVYVFKIQPHLWSLRGPWIRTKYCQDLCELSLFLFFYPPIILRNAALTKKWLILPRAFSIIEHSSDCFFWVTLLQHHHAFDSFFKITQPLPPSSLSCFGERQMRLKRKWGKSETFNLRRLDSPSHTASVMEPQVLVTTLTNAYVRCNKVFMRALWRTPVCHLFQRALLSLYWPTGLAWSSILKIKKHTYAFWDRLTFCCRDFGLTCSILKTILSYGYILWVDISSKWVGGWVRFNQETNCTGLTETAQHRAHKQPNPWSLCPRGCLSNEMKRAPCKAKANKTGNQDQSLLLNEKCSQRLHSCFVGIWFILKEFELPFYPIQLLLIPLRSHGCLHVTQKHIVMAT